MTDVSLRWGIEWRIRRYDEQQTERLHTYLGRAPLGADFERCNVAPGHTSHVAGNLLTTAGLGRITSLITGGGGQALSNTATRVGVGDGTGSASVGDNDLFALTGATHRYFQPADSTFPSFLDGVITIQATFTSANGNFTWNEFGCDIGTPTVTGGTTVNAVLLNHKTSIAQGTKSLGQTWVATATVTLA